MNNSAFEQWYNGMVGFHINSERIVEDVLGSYPEKENVKQLRRWMAVCWNNAIEACENYDGLSYTDLKEPLDKNL